MKRLIYLLSFMVLATSCDEFLDAKPNKQLVIPSNQEDINAILNSFPWINISPMIPFALADDFITTDAHLESLINFVQNAYAWDQELYGPDQTPFSYSGLFTNIFYANVVIGLLENLENIDQKTKNTFYGEVHFIRARSYMELANIYLPLPDTDLVPGYSLPLKISAEVNEQPQYLTADRIYGFIAEEIEKAVQLLPETNQFLTRPTVYAANGLKARLHLLLGNYVVAKEAALKAMEGNFPLMDYNQVNGSLLYPFQKFNQETIYFNSVSNYFDLTSSEQSMVVSELYEKFEDNDIRKPLYFRLNENGFPLFRGSYTGNFEMFDGIAIDEIYLIAAEASIRLGDTNEGLHYLNTLLETRYLEGTYIPVENLDPQPALLKVLEERRKELVFRNQRWSDLKRLNLDPLTQTTISRTINGQLKTLTPNSPQYIFNIPARERAFESR